MPEVVYLTFGGVEYAAEFNMEICIAYIGLKREKDLFIPQSVFSS